MGQAAVAARTLEAAQPSFSANIHHYFVDPKTGHVNLDDEGDALLGYYYEIVDWHGVTVEGLVGPYPNAADAEAACKADCRSKGYI